MLRHESDGSGSVVHWDRLPTVMRDVGLGLGECLGVRPHPIHLVELRSWDGEDAVFHLDEMLGDDVHVPRNQSIEHRQDTAGRRVLDWDDQPIDLTCRDRVKRGDKARIPHPFLVGKQLARRAVAVGEGFTLESDTHGRAR